MLLRTSFLFMSANFKFQLTIFNLLWQYFRKCLKDEAERVASHSGPEINHRVAYESFFARGRYKASSNAILRGA